MVVGGISLAGRPRVPLRLMISLLYLKHAFNESDEGVVERWSETPTWQYFSGQDCFEHRWPCDPSLLVRLRRSLGEEGVEALVSQTINVAVHLKLIARKDLATVIVDSTVQEKAIAYPTDIRMLETARSKLVEAAKAHDIELKQTYAREGRELSAKAGRYAHARQFWRMRGAIKLRRTIVGRLQRKATPGALHALRNTRARVRRVIDQTRHKVRCFSKAKARTPFEFGAKVGLAVTVRGNLIVGARAFSGAPFDGHTLHEQIEQAGILMQDSAGKPTKAVVDLGYRGVDAGNPGLTITHRGRARGLAPEDRKLLKRRNAIEPIFGHLKADHRMDRCHLKGEIGDRLHAVLCAAGYNLRWLLRVIAKRGPRAVLWVLPAQVRTAVTAMFGAVRAPKPSEFGLPLRSAA